MDKAFSYLDIKSDLIKQLQFSHMISKKWKTLVGSVLSKSLFFSYVKKDQCVIRINNPCWYTEIHVYEDKILENLNSVAKERKIRKLTLIMDTKKTKNQIGENKKRQYALRKNYDNMIGR